MMTRILLILLYLGVLSTLVGVISLILIRMMTIPIIIGTDTHTTSESYGIVEDTGIGMIALIGPGEIGDRVSVESAAPTALLLITITAGVSLPFTLSLYFYSMPATG